MFKLSRVVVLMMIAILVLSGCAAPSTPTPLAPFTLPTRMPEAAAPTSSPTETAPAPTTATDAPAPPTETIAQPPTEVAEEPSPDVTVAAAANFSLPEDVQVEPTRPAAAGAIEIEQLALGEPGTYQNLVYGYQITYPEAWYSGFGNRPVVVLFSDLDPAEHNRDAMRSEGCLVEIRASANIYGLSLDELAGQLPRAFAGATAIDLGGQPALRVGRTESTQRTASETIYVEHQDQLFVISIEYSLDAAKPCLLGWNQIIDSWTWFEPAVALYKNKAYGYGVSVPNTWYLFSRSETSMWLSSADPDILYASDDPLSLGMLIVTEVIENDENLALREWVQWHIPAGSLTDEIPTNGLVGIRVIGQGLQPGILQSTGYYLGPLGRVYQVICYYPEALADQYQPIANDVLFSFTF